LETAEHQVHMPVMHEFSEKGRERLAALAAAGGGSMFSGGGGGGDAAAGGEDSGGDDDPFDIVLAYLHANYAFCRTDAVRPIYPMDGSEGVPKGNFLLTYTEGNREVIGPRGGITKLKATAAWLDSTTKMEVKGRVFRPDQGPGVVDEDGKKYINTYRPEVHEAGMERADEALGLWAEFLTHLVPDADERAWFEAKVAAKVQQPGLPGAAVLLVATQQGTGRGTLFAALEGLFGVDNCATVERSKLFGEGGQGQFNDWRADSLLVFVNELLAGQSGGGFQHKRLENYEQLKVIAEPAAVRFEVIAKFKERRVARACASLFIATNNRNALPLPTNDRRIAVLTNGQVRLDKVANDLNGRFHAAKAQPWFLSAVWHHLAALTVDWAAVMTPPHFAGRAAMISANASELDDVIADVLAEVPGDYVAYETLRERVRRKLAALGMSEEPKWQTRMLNALNVTHGPLGWVSGGERVSVLRGDGSKGKVKIVARGGDFRAMESATMEDRQALLAWEGGAEASAMAAKMRERGLTVVPLVVPSVALPVVLPVVPSVVLPRA